MELTAAIEGLRFFKEPTSVAVYTDSQYLRTGAVEWLPAWVRGQYRRKIRGVGWGQIPNAELWKEIDRLIHFHSVTWAWVRGHGDDSINCRCDKLAEKARKAR